MEFLKKKCQLLFFLKMGLVLKNYSHGFIVKTYKFVQI